LYIIEETANSALLTASDSPEIYSEKPTIIRYKFNAKELVLSNEKEKSRVKI